MTINARIIPETPGRAKRLGAHFKEDDRSQQFAFLARATEPVPITHVKHERHIHPMNQNIDVTVNGKVWHGLGSCAPNALISSVSTGPFIPPHPHPSEQKTIVPIYEAVTLRSGDPNLYFPPHDDGCYPLDAMGYALDQGWISEYRSAYSTDEFLQGMMHGPALVATAWPNSFDWAGEPKGVKHHTGNELKIVAGHDTVNGWHAQCADEVQPRAERVWLQNQWGIDYCKEGRSWLAYSTIDELFKRGWIQVFFPIPRS